VSVSVCCIRHVGVSACVHVVQKKISELEKQNGDLRRQLDSQLYASKPDVEHDQPDQLNRDELARRYCKL